jgi:hypothetical protein
MDAPDFSLSIKGKPSKAPGEGPAAPPFGCQIYCDAGSCKVKSCGMISDDPIVHAILISSTGKNVIIRRAHPSAVLLFLLWLDLPTNPQNQKQHTGKKHRGALRYQQYYSGDDAQRTKTGFYGRCL